MIYQKIELGRSQAVRQWFWYHLGSDPSAPARFMQILQVLKKLFFLYKSENLNKFLKS